MKHTIIIAAVPAVGTVPEWISTLQNRCHQTEEQYKVFPDATCGRLSLLLHLLGWHFSVYVLYMVPNGLLTKGQWFISILTACRTSRLLVHNLQRAHHDAVASFVRRKCHNTTQHCSSREGIFSQKSHVLTFRFSLPPTISLARTHNAISVYKCATRCSFFHLWSFSCYLLSDQIHTTRFPLWFFLHRYFLNVGYP